MRLWRRSSRPAGTRHPAWTACSIVLLVALPAVGAGQGAYRYQDENGRWVFSDRPPLDQDYQPLDLQRGEDSFTVEVYQEQTDDGARLVATHTCYCPVEVGVRLRDMSPAAVSQSRAFRKVLPAKATAELARISRQGAGPFEFGFDFGYAIGDPSVQPDAQFAYRPPFAAARGFMVTQAFPDTFTHGSPDSRHAVDIAMPSGTAVHAARAGVVIEVAYANYRGGEDAGQAGGEANFVRILHDDGSFAVYAHLERSSVRVRTGQTVERGEYIASSGNTGYSTGPHLHFAVQRNTGLATRSVPVRFESPGGASAPPARGEELVNP